MYLFMIQVNEYAYKAKDVVDAYWKFFVSSFSIKCVKKTWQKKRVKFLEILQHLQF